MQPIDILDNRELILCSNVLSYPTGCSSTVSLKRDRQSKLTPRDQPELPSTFQSDKQIAGEVELGRIHQSRYRFPFKLRSASVDNLQMHVVSTSRHVFGNPQWQNLTSVCRWQMPAMEIPEIPALDR